MRVIVTLEEMATRSSWERFCDRFGWSYYACKEGGGHIEQELTEEEAREFGLLANTEEAK